MPSQRHLLQLPWGQLGIDHTFPLPTALEVSHSHLNCVPFKPWWRGLFLQEASWPPESASLASCPNSELMYLEEGVLTLPSCLWGVAAPALPCFLASPASTVTMAISGLYEPHKILLLLKYSASAGRDSQGRASGPAPAGESAQRPESSLSCRSRWDSREIAAGV